MPKIKAKDLQAAAEAGRFNKKDRISVTLRMTPIELAATNKNWHTAGTTSRNAYMVGRLTASDSTAGRMRDEDTDYAPSAMSTERSYKQSKAQTATIAGRNK